MWVIDLFETERNAAIVDETTGVKIWRNDRPTSQNPCQLMLFRPRATKPFANYVFPTSEKRAAYIEKQLETARVNNEWKAAQKIERKERDEKEMSDPNPKYKPLKRIAKEVREQLKAEFPNTKWSVRTEYYSMGQHLHVTLVKSNFQVFRTEAEIREHFRTSGWGRYDERDMANLTNDINRGYSQVNEYYIDESPMYTNESKKMFTRVREIVNKDNWDHSDIQTDYFDVHFYTSFNVGTYERPLEVVA